MKMLMRNNIYLWRETSFLFPVTHNKLNISRINSSQVIRNYFLTQAYNDEQFEYFYCNISKLKRHESTRMQ